jgi:hypothetical protein
MAAQQRRQDEFEMQQLQKSETFASASDDYPIGQPLPIEVKLELAISLGNLYRELIAERDAHISTLKLLLGRMLADWEPTGEVVQ